MTFPYRSALSMLLRKNKRFSLFGLSLIMTAHTLAAAPVLNSGQQNKQTKDLKDSTPSAAPEALSYDLIPRPVMLLKGTSGNFFSLDPRDSDSDSDSAPGITRSIIEVPKEWQQTAELLAASWQLPASCITPIAGIGTPREGTHPVKSKHSHTNKRLQFGATKKKAMPSLTNKTRRIIFEKISKGQLQKIIEGALSGNNFKKGVILTDTSALQSHINEAYTLIVTPDEILIRAADGPGAIHGMFTLLQLQKLQWDNQQVPAVSIYDYPRYAYRGLMLDVSRNFFPPMYIKKLLDLMALYKMNQFHWHLTDGAGWRLEIKKYPLLTSRAAFRPEGPQTEWSQSGRSYAKEGAPGSYGGYYSQSEAKEIVAYAAKRGINIIPEIEFPGHTEELLHAYPFLSATGTAKGVHELNVCSDSTYAFMENVLTEVMSVFPSTYIHIGGDEASKRSWEDCLQCQQLMKKKQIKDLNGLQSYGIHRLEKFLNRHGRQLLGWDEITQGCLAPGAAVMVWRNPNTAIQVAREGHKVIQATSKYLYFDHYQSDPMTEPEAIGGYIPLSKV